MESGRSASWLVLGGLVVGVLAQPTIGCLPEETGSSPQQVGDLLSVVGPEVVLPRLQRLDAALTQLEAAVGTWQQEGADARLGAREAFGEAMLVWQELEVMQIGPAASSLTAIAGADLRDEAYSWPTVNPCRVDQETVVGSWSGADFFELNLVNTYGLDALEHLLYAGDDNACPGQVDINAEGTWDALGPQGVDAQRAAYAGVVVGGLQGVHASLVEAWDPAAGDLSGQLAEPGSGGSAFASEQEAINALFDALFYLELVTKDRKLAEPLGLQDCSVDCEQLVEGLSSGLSTAWLAANLRGFRALFTGGGVGGFDVLLDEVGHADLAARMLDNTDAALALIEAESRPLDALVLEDRPAAEAMYEALKAVTDDLKGDLATVLSLQLPNEAAGDND